MKKFLIQWWCANLDDLRDKVNENDLADNVVQILDDHHSGVGGYWLMLRLTLAEYGRLQNGASNWRRQVLKVPLDWR
jgi:hypothetical protein